MNELVKRVTAGWALARSGPKAVAVVVNFLEEPLPAPIAGQLDKGLRQGGFVNEVMKGLNSKLGV